jgi:hypothetical protein
MIITLGQQERVFRVCQLWFVDEREKTQQGMKTNKKWGEATRRRKEANLESEIEACQRKTQQWNSFACSNSWPQTFGELQHQ